ncbi:hypothetical protein ACLKMY_35915 [Paraburkholderia mimosarum]|uniref:hypothetical protein n=1 Tax=Paraburkholderia mimosarum TaxID=312026 RepID=UPI000428CE95|nr:hypothetical protein [Paraburkholderia mimosarum]
MMQINRFAVKSSFFCRESLRTLGTPTFVAALTGASIQIVQRANHRCPSRIRGTVVPDDNRG